MMVCMHVLGGENCWEVEFEHKNSMMEREIIERRNIKFIDGCKEIHNGYKYAKAVMGLL